VPRADRALVIFEKHRVGKAEFTDRGLNLRDLLRRVGPRVATVGRQRLRIAVDDKQIPIETSPARALPLAFGEDGRVIENLSGCGARAGALPGLAWALAGVVMTPRSASRQGAMAVGFCKAVKGTIAPVARCALPGRRLK
jgi:hypothetical protein